ncbi:MAG TPA: flagellar basal body-associated FliL family protein [Amaricoccus sp.]|nr:flagellar basal body-associated FliL family protein [Amaricoccus sp.]
MRKLLPFAIALLGLAAGVGAGLALKPAPEAAAADCPPPPEGEVAADAPCEADPFAPVKPAERKPAAELAYVPMDKPFVVPIFAGEKVTAMVVVSLSVETDTEGAHGVEAVKPRLRDGFLKVMFRHANSGGFDGSFTSGRKMDDLKSALLTTAHDVVPGAEIGEVLITEIARQES